MSCSRHPWLALAWPREPGQPQEPQQTPVVEAAPLGCHGPICILRIYRFRNIDFLHRSVFLIGCFSRDFLRDRGTTGGEDEDEDGSCSRQSRFADY